MSNPGETLSHEPLVRRSGVSLWRQIQERLEGDIVAGRLTPGARCPAEMVLAAEFGVNRHTVRRAIMGLVERGLLKVEQGRGTFVREPVLDYRVGKRTRFRENVTGQSRRPGARLLDAASVAAPKDVARALGLRPAAPVVHVWTMGEVDGRPVSRAEHWFDETRFPTLLAAFQQTNSVTDALAAVGVHDYFRKVTRVTARLPERDEARLLQQSPSRPVIISESINVDESGRIVEYGVTRFVADRVQLVFEP